MEKSILISEIPLTQEQHQTNRTIEEVLDIETGEIIFAEDFFAQEESIVISARNTLELSIQSDIPKYKCIYCEQKVKISGKRIFDRKVTVYFFAHFKDSDDCPIKTSSGLNLEKVLAKKYHGLKESEKHIELKNFIAEQLEGEISIAKGVQNVYIEKVVKNSDISENWRKPDVKAKLNEKSLVFELQLSTTFLSVVIGRESFYRKHQIFLIWVFGGLELDGDWQKLMEKDIYYAHKRNVFVLDNEAQKMSKEKGELVLHCFWQTPLIVNGKVEITWHKKFITLEDLTYDNESYDVYYYNSDKDFYDIADPKQKAIIDAWDKAKEERWDKILARIKDRSLSVEQQEKLLKRQELQEQVLLKKYENGEFAPTRFEQDGKWGYKVKNHVVIEPQFTSVGAFKDGIAIVKNLHKEKIVINLRGDKIIYLGEVKVLDISRYNEFYFLINIEWHKNDYIGRFSRIKIIKKVEEKKFFNLNGDVYSLETPFCEGTANVVFKGITGLINEMGIHLIDTIIPLNSDVNKIKIMGLWGLNTLDGKEIISCQFDKMDELTNGKIRAKRNNKYGFIDEYGNTIIPFECDEIEDFIDGKVKAKKNNKWGFINEMNQILILFEFDEVKDFIKGRAEACKNGKWGFIDQKGNIKIEAVLSIKKDLVKIKKMGFWGLCSLNGIEVGECEYDEIEEFSDGKIKVKKNSNYGHINEKGEIINPVIFTNQMINKVSNTKIIDDIEVYESVSEGFVIPSLRYLSNASTLAFFKKNTIKAKIIDRANFGIFLYVNPEISKGLLHNSEIYNAKYKLNDSKFSIGNIIDVYIKDLQIYSNIADRISFSLPHFKNSIDTIFEELKKLEGTIVEGKITNIKEFGLFVQVCENAVGLIHVSNLKRNGFQTKSLEMTFTKGHSLNVVIISVNVENKKIELGYIK